MKVHSRGPADLEPVVVALHPGLGLPEDGEVDDPLPTFSQEEPMKFESVLHFVLSMPFCP